MARISHDNNGTWIKEYQSIRWNALVKRQYIGDATFLVLSLNVTRGPSEIEGPRGDLEITIDSAAVSENMSIYFGQHIATYKNLSLLKKFYFDYDVSVNKAWAYNSTINISGEDEQLQSDTQIFQADREVQVLDFLIANDLPSSNGESIEESFYDSVEPLPNFYDLYFGYSHIRDVTTDYNSTRNYEAIVSEQLSTVSADCFNWVKIVNGYFEEVPSFVRSSTLLVDYRVDINTTVILEWIRNNFSNVFEDLADSLGSSSIDFNFIFYPPASTSMQFEDIPVILSPSVLNKNKLVSSVVFEVKRSIVSKAQKYFVVDFIDVATGLSIFTENSYLTPNSFVLDTPRAKIYPKSFPLQSSIFEMLTDVDYPDTKFKVTYTLPTAVSSYLSNHLNYKIIVKVSDLTSERST